MENLENYLGKDLFKYGLYSFRFGIILLPSAPFISILFLLISSFISLIYSKDNYLHDRINQIFLSAAILMLCSSFIHLYKFSFNQYSELLISKWDPSLSFIGLLNWIPLFCCFFLFQIYLKDNKDREVSAKCFILGVIPVIVSGIGQTFFNWQDPMTLLNGLIIWYQKALNNPPFELSGLFSNPNYTGMWFNLTLPLVLAYFIRSKNTFFKRNLIFGLILIIIFSIILTSSRAAWAGIIFSLILICGKKSFIYLSCLMGILILVILLCVFPLFGESLQLFFQNIIPNNIWMEFSTTNFLDRPSRFEIWQKAIDIIRENPIFGSGAATFPVLTKGQFVHKVYHSHNLPLEIALNYGLPSLFLIVGSISLIVFVASKKIFFSNPDRYKENIFDRAWISALIILMVTQLFDIQYFDGRISIASWIFISGLNSFLEES